jgi:hypothetical protein
MLLRIREHGDGALVHELRGRPSRIANWRRAWSRQPFGIHAASG